MNYQLLIPLLITSLIKVGGWYALHWFTTKRDKRNKQKELRVNYLIEAWRKLEYAANRKDVDLVEYLEKLIGDIQLLGRKKQIEMIQRLAYELTKNQGGSIIEILNELRQDLRKELNLEKIATEIKIFRINPNDKKSNNYLS